MTYLVTGAAGFIASKVCEQLLNDGKQIVGIDNLNDAYDPTLKEYRLKKLKTFSNFTFQKIDIANKEELTTLFENNQFEAIINLAARAGVRQSIENPWVYIDTNTTGTLNLLEACRTHNIKKFILASTSSLYGSHNPMPYLEDADTNHPLSPYAASKKGAEAMAATYAHLYKLDATVLRYFTVYGPAGRPDMSVFRFIRWIAEGDEMTVYGDGSQGRDFTFVDDIARGTIAALNDTGYDVINLGGDKPAKLSEMISLIEKFLGKKAKIINKPFHSADMMATWADVTKAKKKLNWEAKTSLEEGIKKSVDWYLENREWAKKVDLGKI